MTGKDDPLERVASTIDALDCGEVDFWTPLATPRAAASNRERQENRPFGRLGQLGRSETGSLENPSNIAHAEIEHLHIAKRRCLARKAYPESVQSVQSVQSQPAQPVNLDVQLPASVQGVQSCGLPDFSADPGEARRWLNAKFQRLGSLPAPVNYPQDRWRQFLLDADAFCQEWAEKALVLGWPPWELFGCHRPQPWRHIRGLGLVLLLKGDELVAMTATEAVIRTRTGARQTYRRKPADPLRPAERCLAWELVGGHGPDLSAAGERQRQTAPPPWTDAAAWLESLRQARTFGERTGAFSRWVNAAGGNLCTENEVIEAVLPADLPSGPALGEIKLAARKLGVGVRQPEGTSR